MFKNQAFDIEIDKLTRSIENAVSGDKFKTIVLKLIPKDITQPADSLPTRILHV